jgi:hypothetical protein
MYIRNNQLRGLQKTCRLTFVSLFYFEQVNTEQQVNVTDFTPVRVTTIQILELNQDLRVIAQTPINGDFRSGDTFRYTSVIAQLDPSKVDPNTIPKGFQITLAGKNQEEQDLVNFWLIIYDNNCGVFPVVLKGEQIGWTVFVSK